MTERWSAEMIFYNLLWILDHRRAGMPKVQTLAEMNALNGVEEGVH
jgi:hypothetical protein